MSIQNFDTFNALTSGFKYLPHSIVLQTAAVTAAVGMGWVDLTTIKNAYFPENCEGIPNLSIKDKVIGLFTTIGSLLLQPIVEEVAIRGILQDGLLTRAPRGLLGLCGKGHLAFSLAAKTVRTAISAAVFSTSHLSNQNILRMSDKTMNFQLANTFGMGLALAALKETTGSIWPGIGVHTLHNNIVLPMSLLSCMTRSDETPKPASPTETPSNETPVSGGVCRQISGFAHPSCHRANQILAENAAQLTKKSESWRENGEMLVNQATEYETEAAALLKKSQSSLPEAS